MSLYPPDGWNEIDGFGVWNTDVLLDESLFQSGDSSIKMLPDAAGISPVGLNSDPMSVSGGGSYEIDVVLAADSTSANHLVAAQVYFYNAAGSLIGAGLGVSVSASVSSTWERRKVRLDAPATAVTLVVRVAAASLSGSFTAWIDDVILSSVGTAFSAYAGGATSLVDVTWTKVTFNTESYDYAGAFSSSAFTAPYDGYFHFDTGVRVDSPGDGTNIALSFYVNGATSLRVWDSIAYTTADHQMGGSGEIKLSAGDTVDVRAYQNSGGAINTIVSTAFYTWFNGHEIR